MSFVKKVKVQMLVIAMSNLRSSDTGVEGAVIWVSAGEFEGKKSQHGPRIKVVLGNKTSQELLKDGSTTVTISGTPTIIGTLPTNVKKQVLKFVKKNSDLLLKYWNQDISSREMLDGIERC